MKIAVTHPTGNQNLRAVLDAFSTAGLLEKFHTTIAVNKDSEILKFIPGKIRQELLRRTFSVNQEKIRTYPFLELCRMILPKLGAKGLVTGESSFAGIDSVYRNFDKKVAANLFESGTLDAVYAYEDGALETFRAAKKMGVKCIYDLPIAYWETARTLLEIEASRLPAWKVTLGGGISDSKEKLDRKTEELELADMVVGPGSFVMNSLPFWAKNKRLVTSPFGSPDVYEQNFNNPTVETTRRLRVLFVGSMGQRKGLGDLFAAMKILKRSDIELVVMGSLLAPAEFYRSEYSDFTYEPGRPHQKVLELMRSCDVFCLPSIVEGRALVMQEAMSQGLPLIITANTGGEDLIIEGETGFLVPVSSPMIIAEKLNWYADHREAIKPMGVKAMNHAAAYTWKSYGEKIVNEVSTFI